MAISTLGLDASQLIAELAKAEAAFRSHAAGLGDLAKVYGTINQEGKVLEGTFTAITKSGEKIKATFEDVGGTFNVVTTSVNKVEAATKTASTTMEKFKDAADKAGQSAIISFQQLARVIEIQLVHRFIGAFITEISQGISKAAELQLELSRLTVVAQPIGVGFEQLQEKIKSLSDEFATPQIDVAQAAFQALSTQVIKSGSDLNVLNDILAFSKIANTSAADAAKLLSIAINGFHIPAEQAQSSLNSFFRAAQLGGFNAAQISTSFERIGASASELGVSLSQSLGLLTTLTRSGLSPNEAIAQINAVFSSLLKPSTQMKQFFQDIGVASGQAAVSAFGFQGVLERLLVAVNDDNRGLQDLASNTRALRGILGATGGTTGTGFNALTSNTGEIQNAQQAASQASAQIASTSGEKFKELTTSINNGFIEFGNKFVAVLDRIAPRVSAFSSFIRENFAAPADVIAVIIGSLTNTADAFDQLTTANARYAAQQHQLNDLMEIFATQQRKLKEDLAAQTTQFNADLQSRTAFVLQAVAVVSQYANAVVAEQRRVVQSSTEFLKEAARNVADELAKRISDIRKQITTAEDLIKSSRKRLVDFADRESTDFFQRQLRQAATPPQVINVSGDLTSEQEQVQRLQRAGQAAAFRNEIFVIQQRINQLLKEANDLIERGDKESTDSARRKFEDIRKLTEQQFDVQEQARREVLVNQATDTARVIGGVTQVNFQQNFDLLRQRLGAVGQQEQALEARIQVVQQRIIDAQNAQLAVERQRQTGINNSIEALARFNLLNEQGQLRPQFQGPQGIERARSDLDAIVNNIQSAIGNSGLRDTTQQSLLAAVSSQRIAVEQQIEREVTAIRLKGIADRIEAERRGIQTQQQEAATAIARANEFSQGLVVQVRAGLNELQRDIALAPDALRNSSDTQTFTRRINELREALAAYNRVRGQGNDEEAAAISNVQRLLNLVGQSQSAFFNSAQLRDRLFQSPQGPITGAQVAQGPGIAQFAPQFGAAADQLQIAQDARANAQQRSDAINQLARELPANLQVAVLSQENIGNRLQTAIGETTAGINTVASRIQDLIDLISRFGNTGPNLFANPPRPAPLPEETPGFASGGLIGGAFNSRGPDTRIVAARDGEFIVNPESTRRFFSQITAINAGQIPHFAQGGLVSTTNVGDIHVNVDGSKHPESTARAVISKINRELRRGNGRI